MEININDLRQGTPKEIIRAYRKAMYEQYEESTPLPVYEDEVALFNCVKNGNTEDIDSLLLIMNDKLAERPTGVMSHNPLRQAQFTVVSGITLVTRYALAGGLPAAEAFHLSDAYLQRLDQTITQEDAFFLFFTALRDFTERVKRHKKTGLYTYPVHESILYINDHLHKKITLTMLAERVNVTPEYLSSVFHKETGMTVSEYIRTEKLKVAERMLTESPFPIGRISEMLDFPSSSAFITYFKKQYGTTPSKYREQA